MNFLTKLKTKTFIKKSKQKLQTQKPTKEQRKTLIKNINEIITDNPIIDQNNKPITNTELQKMTTKQLIQLFEDILNEIEKQI